MLPNLMLATSKHLRAVTDGEVPLGDWFLRDGDKLEPLGNAVQAVLLYYGTTIIDLNEGYECRDQHDERFQKSLDKLRSYTHDKAIPHVMFGPECLVYLPRLQRYTIYFAGSVTGRSFVLGRLTDNKVVGAIDYLGYKVHWLSNHCRTSRGFEFYMPKLMEKYRRKVSCEAHRQAIHEFCDRPATKLFPVTKNPHVVELIAKAKEVGNKLSSLGYKQTDVNEVGFVLQDEIRRSTV